MDQIDLMALLLQNQGRAPAAEDGEDPQSPVTQLMYPQAPNPFSPMGLVSVTRDVKKGSGAQPLTEADFLQKQLLAMQAQGIAQQQEGVKNYEQKLKDFTAGQGVNPWQAVAAGVSDFLNGGNKLDKVSQAQQQQKQLALMGEEKLQGAKSEVSKNQNALIKTQLDYEKAREKNAADEERTRMMFGLAKEKLNKGEKSALFESADKAFGKEFQDWNAQGGYANVEKQLNALEQAASALESDPTLSGGINTALPDSVRRRVYPEQMKIEQQVKQAVQSSLRQTLGSQFTEKEGEAIMQRSYDPALPAADNVAKIRATVQQLRTQAIEKENASKYALQHGTLEGYKSGNLSGVGTSGLTPEQEARRQALLKKKAGGK